MAATNYLKRLAEDVDGPFDGYPDIDKKSCSLLGPTALIVQGLMGVLVVLSLVYKRQHEKPKRPWRIWVFDVSKQVVGQMFVHGVNVLVSDLISHHSSANACVSYFLNILIDTTLGVALIYFILHFLTYLLSEKLQLEGFESGKYGSPPSFTYWIRQAATYVLSLTTMKFLVLGLMALFPGIFKIGEWLLGWTWTGKGDALQVIFVMGIFPILMNILQFWLIDSIVKASSTASSVVLEPDSSSVLDNQDREPLFRSSSDDEDDDDTQANDVENQRRRIRSTSRSPTRSQSHVRKSLSPKSSNPIEDKSSGSSTISQGLELHPYPPNLTGSTTLATISSSSSSDSVSSLSGRRPTKRRSPPSPLQISPISQPAINSPQIFTPIPAQKPHNTLSNPQQTNTKTTGNEWADSWQDSDDWANRVGEEEWTGRRIEQTKETLNGAWETGTPTVRVES